MLDSVRKAEDILHQKKSDKEYLPITVSRLELWYSFLQLTSQGLAQFLVLASELAYGKDSKPLQEGRVSNLSAPRTLPADAARRSVCSRRSAV